MVIEAGVNLEKRRQKAVADLAAQSHQVLGTGSGDGIGRLKGAQARGDIRALLARGRRVAHVHLARPEDVSGLTAV